MHLYIDFGGTNFRYRFDDGEIYILNSVDVDIKFFLDEIINQYQNIQYIGISFAGIVQNGVILSSPNIKIERFNIVKYINDRYNITLKIDNDLNCVALAEYQQLQKKSLAIFYIGTGFGSAFFSDGKIVRGKYNQAGEIGHIPFIKAPFACGCGRDDCLELSCSGSGIKRWCEYYGIDQQYGRLDLLQNSSNTMRNKIIENFYNGLAHAFHTALALFDFEYLVLGGSVANHPNIQDFLKQELYKSAFGKKKITIMLSTLNEGALEGTKYLN